MRIRDKIDKKKLSHCMFNDEEIVCMNKKYFNDNYIRKDKIREMIKEIKPDIFDNEEDIKKFDYCIYILNELLEE